jgi:hypothetical protein
VTEHGEKLDGLGILDRAFGASAHEIVDVEDPDRLAVPELIHPGQCIEETVIAVDYPAIRPEVGSWYEHGFSPLPQRS